MKTFLKNKLVLISLGFFLISLSLLSLVYFRNAPFMPLVLHYVGDTGDFLGSRSGILGLVLGFVSLCILDYFISFRVLKDKPLLAKFMNVIVLILNVFLLVLS
jgi:hypothetical protein